jgi:hypothetical protein
MLVVLKLKWSVESQSQSFVYLARGFHTKCVRSGVLIIEKPLIH